MKGLLGQGRGVVGRRGLPGGRRVRGLRPGRRLVVQLRLLLVHRRRRLREVRGRRRRGLRRRHLNLYKARTDRDSRLQWPSTWLWLRLLVPCGEGCMKQGANSDDGHCPATCSTWCSVIEGQTLCRGACLPSIRGSALFRVHAKAIPVGRS